MTDRDLYDWQRAHDRHGTPHGYVGRTELDRYLDEVLREIDEAGEPKPTAGPWPPQDPAKFGLGLLAATLLALVCWAVLGFSIWWAWQQ